MSHAQQLAPFFLAQNISVQEMCLQLLVSLRDPDECVWRNIFLVIE